MNQGLHASLPQDVRMWKALCSTNHITINEKEPWNHAS